MKQQVVALMLVLVFAMTCAHSETAVADVRVELDEPRAAIALLEDLAAGREPVDTKWAALWNSHGYRRLLARETAMGRGEGFAQRLQAWLREPETVAQLDGFRAAVVRWEAFDATRAAKRARHYLPAETALRATLFPVLKHTTNSFVFDLEGDPAVFINMDPGKDADFLEAVMTHELHHVGLAHCPQPPDYDRLTPVQQRVADWLGVFGEGLAVLATAGDPFRHPHYYSDADQYAVWERDVARFNLDLARSETIFRGVLEHSIAEDQQRPALFTLIASNAVPQGPAYTVGWKMAALVERHFGHAALINAICDPRMLLRLYNDAATVTASSESTLARWSPEFLAALESGAD